MVDGNGAEKQVDPKVLARTVEDRPTQTTAQGTPLPESSLLWFIASAADEMEPWGRSPKERDRQLREFMTTESIFLSALGIVVARNSAFDWKIEGTDQTVGVAQELLLNANLGEGWEDFIAKVSNDLYSQDSGAFIEIVRDGDAPEAAPIGINHLDAMRCLGRDTGVRLGGNRRGQTKSIYEIVKDEDPGPILSIGPDGQICEKGVIAWYRSPLSSRRWLHVLLQNSKARSNRGGGPTGPWVTHDHEFLTPDGWVEAQHLRPGSQVVTEHPSPSSEQCEVLVGSMLGDGHLNRSNRLSLTHSEKQGEWLELKVASLQGFDWCPTRVYYGPPERRELTAILTAEAHGTPGLSRWRRQWYPQGKKVVAREFVEEFFTPRMLATWYLDDGSLLGEALDLSTNGFEKSESEWLAELLTRKGYTAKVIPYNYRVGPHAGETYWFIRMSTPGARKFFSDIGSYVPLTLRYKLPPWAPKFDSTLWDITPARRFIDRIEYVREGTNGQQTTAYCIDVEDTHNFVATGAIVHNCWHTGSPEEPVIYKDRKDKFHLLPWYNVATLAEMPTSIEGLYGLQYCALTRLLLAAQIIKNITIYKKEKTGGRHNRAIHLVSGITSKQIEAAIAQYRVFADAEGLQRYVNPIIVGSPDPDANLQLQTLELASLPDGFTEETTFKHYITQIAMAFLSDYQEFAPLPGGNLGTSTQSEMLHLKSRGKGPAIFQELITRFLNFRVLPQNVTFKFEEQDLEAEETKAKIARTRAEERKLRIESTEITPEEARQMAADDGDLPQTMLEATTQDATPSVTATGDEPFTEEKGVPIPEIDEDKQQKASKGEVEYRASEGMQKCGNCLFFQSPSACQVVQGRIRTVDVCNLWVTTTSGAKQEEGPRAGPFRR